MVSLLLVQGIEFPKDALWLRKIMGMLLLKNTESSRNFLKIRVVSGIFLCNFLLVYRSPDTMNPLDSVVRIEHDPENFHLKQELDGTLDVAIRYECFMYRKKGITCRV